MEYVQSLARIPVAAIPAMEIRRKKTQNASTTTTAIGSRRPRKKRTKLMIVQITTTRDMNTLIPAALRKVSRDVV